MCISPIWCAESTLNKWHKLTSYGADYPVCGNNAVPLYREVLHWLSPPNGEGDGTKHSWGAFSPRAPCQPHGLSLCPACMCLYRITSVCRIVVLPLWSHVNLHSLFVSCTECHQKLHYIFSISSMSKTLSPAPRILAFTRMSTRVWNRSLYVPHIHFNFFVIIAFFFLFGCFLVKFASILVIFFLVLPGLLKKKN